LEKLRSSGGGSSSSVGGTPVQPAAAAAADATPVTETAAEAAAEAAAAVEGNDGQDADEAHRANAARGPTSLANLAAAQAATAAVDSQEHEEQEQAQKQLQALQLCGTETVTACAAQPAVADSTHEEGTKQQQQHDDELTQLAVQETAISAVAVQRVVSTTKIYLLSGDLKRSLTGKPKFAGKFAAATVGHRHVHLLAAESGLAGVLRQRSGVVFVETGQNMVQLNDEQAAAFEQRVAELAAPAGFVRDPAFSSSSVNSKNDGNNQQQQQQQQQSSQGNAAAAAAAVDSSSRAAGGPAAGWRLAPGHMALHVEQQCQAGDAPA
jgi:dynein assembly factor 3